MRDTALLLAGLVLVAALADGELVNWLTYALIGLWALSGFLQDRGAHRPSEGAMPLWGILAPLFVAIAIAIVFAEGEWFYVVLFAIALPLIVLTRVGMSLWSRRKSRQSQAAT